MQNTRWYPPLTPYSKFQFCGPFHQVEIPGRFPDGLNMHVCPSSMHWLLQKSAHQVITPVTLIFDFERPKCTQHWVLLYGYMCLSTGFGSYLILHMGDFIWKWSKSCKLTPKRTKSWPLWPWPLTEKGQNLYSPSLRLYVLVYKVW